MKIAAALSGIEAVALDLDGTMVDTLLDFHAAVNTMRANLGLSAVPPALIGRLIGRGTEHLIGQALALDYPAAEVEARLAEAIADYLAIYRGLNGRRARVYPGVVQALQDMRGKNLRLACVTNKPYDFADELLCRCALRDFFELLIGGDSLPARKPDPLPLRRVCAEFGIASGALLMIGDSSNDARAARAAGCPVLIVPYGYNHGEDVHVLDSDGIVLSLQDAARHINPTNIAHAST